MFYRSLCLVTLCASALLAAERKQSISTTGEAMICVAPDEVITQFGIEIFHEDLDTAKTTSDVTCKKLLAAIKAFGIEEKDIQSDILDVDISYKDHVPSKGIAGYFTRRGYSVTLKDISKFEKLIDTALKNGANILMGFQFRTNELRKHRDEARKKAVIAAREKAADMIAVIDGTNLRPTHISEDNYWYNDHASWRSRGGYGYYGSQNRMSQNYVQVQGGNTNGGETLPLGKISITARVSMTFDYTVKE